MGNVIQGSYPAPKTDSKPEAKTPKTAPTSEDA